MACKGCGRAWCKCRVDSTTTIRRTGTGNPGDAFVFDYILDPDPDNDVEVTEDGLLMLPRSSFARPLGFSARFGELGIDVDDLGTILPSDLGFRRIITYNEVTFDTGGMLDPTTGIFTCPRAGIWEMIANSSLVDTDVYAGFGIALNNIHTLAMSGIHLIDTQFEDDIIIVHEELDVGDELSVFWEVLEFGMLVRRGRFSAIHLGD